MHISDDDLVLIYYGEPAAGCEEHLAGCGECAARLAALRADLARLQEEMPVPERGEEYGRWTWFRLQPKLAARRSPWRRWTGVAASVAAVAVLVLGAFFAGRYSMNPATPVDAELAARPGARVYRAALGQHLERSQLVLREIENAPAADESDFSDEQERAESLLTANRLYRQEAASEGDNGTANVLEDLERILLEVAHAPARVSAEDLEEIRRRIREQKITFRVKVEEVQQEVLSQ